MKANNPSPASRPPSLHVNYGVKRLKCSRHVFPFLTIGVLCASLALPKAYAATNTWTGATNATWTTSTNWSPSGAPGTAGGTANTDTAIFNNNTNTTITVDDGRNIKFITFDTGAGAFTFNPLAVSGTNMTTAANSIWQILSGATNSQTFNTTIGLNGATNTFLNNSTTGGVSLNFGSTITGLGAAQTLVLGGLGNGSVSGAVTSLSGTLALTKTGGGTWTLSSTSNNLTGAITLNGGKVSGLLTTGTTGTFTMTNGEWSFSGTSAAATSQNTGALTLNGGRNTLTVIADPAQASTLTIASFATRAQYATELFRGTNLGVSNPATAGASNILFTAAPILSTGGTAGSWFSAVGTGTLGTTQAAVLRGALADTTGTGNGTGFATYDATKGVRLLSSGSEQLSVTTAAAYTSASTSDNVLISNTTIGITGKQTNTLQIDNTTAGAIVLTNTGTALNPVNGLLFTGTSAISLSGGTLASTGNDAILLSTNSAGVTIGLAINDTAGGGQHSVLFGGPGNFQVNSTLSASSSGGFYFNGPGTVTLNASQSPSSAGLNVIGGTVKFGSSFVWATARPFRVAAGATLDINGVSVTNLDGLFDGGINGISGGGTIQNSGATVTLGVNNATNGAGSAGTFSGSITGPINFLIAMGSNTFTQTISGSNSYTGTTTINSGKLVLGSSSTLPSTTALTVSGTASTTPSTLDLAGFSPTVASLAGTLAASSTATIINNTTGTSSLTVSGSTSTSYAGFLNDGGAGKVLALTKAGTGTLTLTGSNNYGGGTIINGGTLKANGISSTGTGAVLVNGTGILGGTGSVVGPVTVSSGGHLAPGDSIGTLTLGSVTLSGSSILDYELNGASSSDLAVVSNANGLTINGTNGFNLYEVGTTTGFTTSTGTYNVFQFAGTVQGTGTFSVLNPQFGRGYTFGTSGSFVTLTIANTLVISTWNVNSDGIWGVGGNWDNSTVPDTAGATAVFGSIITAPRTVTLNANRTVGGIIFSNTNAYTIASGTAGSALILDNSTSTASIAVTTGSHTISAPVSLSSSNTTISVTNGADTLTMSGAISGTSNITKSGSGTLALTASNSYNGGTTLNGGVTQINSGASLGATSGTATINNATLEVQNSITTSRSLALGNANSTIQVNDGVTYQVDSSIANGASAGTLIKSGSGLLLLTASNSYTGGTTINSGTVQVGNGGSTGTLGSGNVTNNSALVFNRTGATSITGALANAGTVTNTNVDLTATGALSGTGSITQTGGRLTLSSSSTATGPIAVTSGTLNMGANAAAGTGAITLTNAALTNNNLSTTSSNAITFVGANTIDTFGGSNNMTLQGMLSGSGSITRNGGQGNLTLSGFNDPLPTSGTPGNFTGTFASNTAGTVTFGIRNASSIAAAWSFTGGGIVALGNPGGTIQFGSLSGSNNVTATGTARVRIGDLGLSDTYSGVIGSSGASSIALIKTGTGALRLEAQNLYSLNAALTSSTGGATYVAQGSLIAGASTTGTTSGPFGPSANVIAIGNPGASLNGNTTAALFNASLLAGGAFTVANPIIVTSGNVATSSTTYTLTLGGNTDNISTFSGAVTLQNNLTISQVATTGSNALYVTGNIAGTVANVGPGSSLTNGTNNVNNTGTQTLTFSGPGAINVSGTIGNGGGIVGVTVTGGTTTLSATNTYTGATNVNNGTLNFAVSETLAGGLTIASSGTAVLTAHSGGPANVKVLDLSSLGITTSFALLDNTNGGAGGSDDGSQFASPAPVPEPGTVGLILIGGVGLLAYRRQLAKRRKS